MIKFIGNDPIIGQPALLIYSMSGNGELGLFPGLPSFELNGYRMPLPLPVIDYNNPDHASISHDTREQMYWSTSLLPDTTGRARITFFNNDITKRYRVLIHGFRSDGTPVYLEQELSSAGQF